MKALLHRIYAHPNYTKLVEWGGLILITGSAQILVQAIALISGILVIRQLPANEYAFYTLANTMLGTMTILADSGISTGVLAQGSKVWTDQKKLGAVLVTGLELRKKFAIASLIIAIPLLLFLLLHHDASWLMAVLIVVSLIPAFFTALSGTLYEVAPKLKQDIAPLQKNQVNINIGRLALLGIVLFAFPYAFLAILCVGIPQIFGNRNLKKISSRYADWSQKSDLGVQKQIIQMVKRIAPGSIYYCFSGQITFFLISVVGSTQSVAKVGALGRLAMALTLFTVLFNTLIIPRFSRLPDDKSLLRKRYLKIQAGLLILTGCITLLAWLFSEQLLWLLGSQYEDLKNELVLNILASCLHLIVGISFGLNTGRGWTLHPAISIPLSMASIAVGVVLIDISIVKGFFILNIFLALVEIIMYISYALIKINDTKKMDVLPSR